MGAPQRPIAAFRKRLVDDPELQAFVGADTDLETGARVYPDDVVDVEQAVYPCITLSFDRARLTTAAPRTIDPGFMTVEFWSKEDQLVCYRMYEIATQLLHDQKARLSTAEFCCHFVQEVDYQRARFIKTRSAWRVAAIYKFRASIRT